MYRTYSFDDLTKTIGKHTNVTTKNSANGSIVLSEYGARLIGLFPDRSQTNTLWTADALDALMPRHAWNIGGERLWVAPERDYYYENPRDFEGWHCPASMDPGYYKTIGEASYSNDFSLLNLSTNESYDSCISTRTFSPMSDPVNTGLPYAGVSIEDTLLCNAPDVSICCWSLSQVYCCGSSMPGTALFATKGTAVPVPYFGEIPADRYDAKNGYARFKIDIASIYKFTIKPEDLDFDNQIKVLYLSPYPAGGKWFCVVKRSNDIPRSQAECVDKSKTDPDGLMGAVQSYNSGTNNQGETTYFGEIELQLTKGITLNNLTQSKARHEVLAYSGTKDEMTQLARELLKLKESPVLY